MTEPETKWQTWRRIVQGMPREMARLGPTIGAPVEYTGHRNLIMAFRRGVVCGLNPELETLPRWYTGEETSNAFRRGWAVGRHRVGAAR